MVASSKEGPDLFAWQSPKEMAAAADEVRRKFGERKWSNPARHWIEAYVASRFAHFSNIDSVKLLRPLNALPTPDFALRMGSDELWIETTEADRLGRQRGAEHITPFEDSETVPESEWVEPAVYHALVNRLVEKKARKAYTKCDGLIVWSNAFPIADEEFLTYDWWQSAVEPARRKFDAVWVHFHGEFIRVI